MKQRKHGGNYMKYTIKNIKFFIKNEKMIFLLVLFCVMASSFVINFSYGLYQNYSKVKSEEESELHEFRAFFNNSETDFASKDKVKEVLLSFPSELHEAVDMYLVSPVLEEFVDFGFNRTDIRFCIKNGNVVPCEVFENNLTRQSMLYSGRYFSEQEEKDGERVAIVSGDKMPGAVTGYTDKLMIDDETIMFQGNEYKIIGIQTFEPIIVPFNCLKDDTPINDMIFHFKKPVTRLQYNTIKEKLEMGFPNIVEVSELDIPESENYYLYNTIILISVLIAILAAVNFAVLYKYILSKRMKSLAIFRICGCTELKVLGMFLNECMIIAVPVFSATVFAYDKLVLPKLGQHFEYIEGAYNLKLYLLISAIYIITTFIVLLIMIYFGFLNKKIIEAKKGE